MNSKKSLRCILRLFSVSSLALTFTLLLITSCSFSSVNLDITAKNHLNHDTYYRALPVVVRVYTLKNPESFSDATFRELWHKKVLGDNLVSRQEFTVVPGSTLHASISRNSSAQYLGAVALFRHPLHNQWRVITPMPFWTSSLILSGNSIGL
jgi:type VI secretion system protein VasD